MLSRLWARVCGTKIPQSVFSHACSVISNSCVMPWTVAHKVPLFTRFSRQEYWGGFQFSPPGNYPNYGIKSKFPALQADSLPSEPPGKPTIVFVTQACPTLCNPRDYSLPYSSVHEILPARILEWVAIPFSRASSQPRDQTRVSCTAGRLFTY